MASQSNHESKKEREKKNVGDDDVDVDMTTANRIIASPSSLVQLNNDSTRLDSTLFLSLSIVVVSPSFLPLTEEEEEEEKEAPNCLELAISIE